jgi:hypothetical protein
MDWWAVCVPRAACLILGPHSSFNSAVTSNTVKLSDIWWENIYVWTYHCKVTSCTEPDNAHITSTLRRVRSTIVAVEKLYYIFWACVCSFWYPECNEYVPYCHLWSVRLYHIFLRYHIKGAIFEKKCSNIKQVFSTILSEAPLNMGRIERRVFKMYVGIHVKYLSFLSDFNKNLIFWTDFRKVLNYRISWKSVQW